MRLYWIFLENTNESADKQQIGARSSGVADVPANKAARTAIADSITGAGANFGNRGKGWGGKAGAEMGGKGGKGGGKAKANAKQKAKKARASWMTTFNKVQQIASEVCCVDGFPCAFRWQALMGFQFINFRFRVSTPDIPTDALTVSAVLDRDRGPWSWQVKTAEEVEKDKFKTRMDSSWPQIQVATYICYIYSYKYYIFMFTYIYHKCSYIVFFGLPYISTWRITMRDDP